MPNNATQDRPVFLPAVSISKLLIGGDSRANPPTVAVSTVPLLPTNEGPTALNGASSAMRNWAALIRDMCGVDNSVWKVWVPPVTLPSTTVAAGSNGVVFNGTNFSGTQSLSVAAIPSGTLWSGSVSVYVAGTTPSVLTYSGITSGATPSLNNCTFVSGSGTLATGNSVTFPTTVTTALGVLDIESIIMDITYTPLTALAAGNATNYRSFSLQALPVTGAAYNIMGSRNNDGVFLNGITAGQEVSLQTIHNTGTGGSFFMGYSMGDTKQYLGPGTLLTWVSTFGGVGQADPGGLVTVRFIGRYANLAVGGSRLTMSNWSTNPTQGGWSQWAQLQPQSRWYGAQMKCTVAYPGSGTAVTVDQVPNLAPLNGQGAYNVLVPGDRILFSGGTTLQVNANQGVSATAVALTVVATAGTVAVGEVGVLKKSAGAYGYAQTNSSTNGLVTTQFGINDAINNAGEVNGSWKEAMRHHVAISCCAYRQYGFGSLAGYNQDNTIVTTNGNGAASWSLTTDGTSWCARPQHLRLTGSTTLGATQPTLTVTIPPWYDGVGAVDLFFASKMGQLGGKATITYGQAQAAATALFTGANSSFNIKVNGGNTAGTNDVIDNGFAAAITSQANSQGVGMVKRITGLPAGGGTIVLTVTNLFSAGSELIFDLWGIESVNPATPVLVLGVSYIPQTTVTNATIDSFNAATKLVIAERTESPANVVYMDTNSLVNNGDPAYFCDDGIHYNDRGNYAIAAAVSTQAGLVFTPAQLGSR